jgi:hypothetical protein
VQRQIEPGAGRRYSAQRGGDALQASGLDAAEELQGEMEIFRGDPADPARGGAQALDLRAEPRAQRVGKEDRDE